MRDWVWLQTLKSLVFVMRVLFFEKFEMVILIGWWLLISTAGVIFFWLDYRVSIGVMVTGLLIWSFAKEWFMNLKPHLIRRGDTIEFADPNAELSEQFKKAVMISPIAVDVVVKRQLFDSEQAKEYERFFLVTSSQKTLAIPYEWIIGIDFDESTVG